MKWIPIHKKRPPIGDVFLLVYQINRIPYCTFAVLLANGNLCIDKDIQGMFEDEYDFKELAQISKEGITVFWTEFHFPEGL